MWGRKALFGFAIGAAYFPGIPSAALMPRWWVLAISLPLISRCDPRALRPGFMVCLLGVLVWGAAASILFSPHPHSAALEWYMLALLGLSAVAAAEEGGSEIILGLGWGVAVSAALCLPQSLGWSPVPQITAPAGLFLSSEVMAETAAPLLVWSIMDRRPALAVLLLIPVVLCGSRTAALAAVVGLTVAWQPRNGLWKFGLLAAVMVAGAAAMFVLGLAKAHSGMDRMVLWVAAVDSIVPFGRGLGWWAAGHPAGFEEFVHSDALQAVVELGIGAAFLFVMPFAVLREIDHEDLALRSGFFAALVECVVSFPLHVPAAGFMVFALAGRLARRRDSVRRHGFVGGICSVLRFRRAAAHLATMAARRRRDHPVVSL